MQRRSVQRSLRERVPVVLACIAGLAIPAASAWGSRIDYQKFFLVTDTNLATTSLWAGGMTETWQRLPRIDGFMPLFPEEFGRIGRPYKHYQIDTDADSIRRLSNNTVWGLPIQRVGSLSGGFEGSCTSRDGWDSEASAHIWTYVPQDLFDAIPVRQKNQNGQVEIVNRPVDQSRSGLIKLDGYAKIADIQGYEPSADSFSAAAVSGGHVFRFVDDGTNIRWEATGKQTMVGGAEQRLVPGGVYDPWVFRITDETLDESWYEEVMRLDVTSFDANYLVDDSGISLSIDQSDPESEVHLSFTMPSSWVVNPYEYGAHLTPSGLTAWGATPPEGWSVTTSGTTLTAFYAFGPEGQPWDAAMVRPPSEYFIPGHDYSYDLGAGSGVYILGNVPGPSTLVILAGVIAWAGFRHRAR
jgi:hypothetical protein